MITASQVRRPLIGIALSIVAGLGLCRYITTAPLLWLSIAALLLAVAGRTVSFCRANPLLHITCAVLAAAYGSVQKMPDFTQTVLAASETGFYEQELTGTVQDDPVIMDSGTISFLLRSKTITYTGKIISSRVVLKVYLKNPAVPVQFGETWALKGRYTCYATPQNGVGGFLNVSADDAVRISSAPRSLMRSCYQARRQASKILRSGIEAGSDQTRLLQTLLLGYRQAMPAELYRKFSRTGILHIFAISGLHVGVMAAILIAGLKLSGVSRPLWGWVLIPALFLYVFSTGMKASALRAFTMAAVYFAAPLAGRRPDAASAVSLAAVLLLIINPGNIYNPGFLLSFVVVCGILMMHGWVVRQIQGIHFSKWDTPLKYLNGPHPGSAVLRAGGLLTVTSVAAWLFSIPITAYFFNTLSVGALLGNPVVIPLTFMIMLTGSLTLLCGAVFVPAAAFFNQANVQFINLLLWIVRGLSELPGTCRIVRAPSLLVAGFWYIGLVFFFTGSVRWRKGAALLVFLTGLLWGVEHIHTGHYIRVLRAGDSAVVVYLPEKKQWIMLTDADAYNSSQAIRLLQKKGINRLDTLVITHNRGSGNSMAVQQLQEIFRPAQILYQDHIYLPAGSGTICISPEP